MSSEPPEIFLLSDPGAPPPSKRDLVLTGEASNDPGVLEAACRLARTRGAHVYVETWPDAPPGADVSDAGHSARGGA